MDVSRFLIATSLALVLLTLISCYKWPIDPYPRMTSEDWSAVHTEIIIARYRERCLMAVQGDKASQYRVAADYRFGSFRFPVDLVRSYLWYHYAARGDSKVIEERIAYLVDKMTPSQIAEAERLVKEWEPNPAECEALPEN